MNTNTYQIKSLKYILLYTAGLITFLHSMVPHEHHSDISLQEDSVLYSTNECICDWLQIVFHEDLGAGHLENFVQGEGLNFELQHLAVDVPSLIGLVYTTQNISATENVSHKKSTSKNILGESIFLRHPDALRGPPKQA